MTKPTRICQIKPVKPNLSSQIYQTKPSKPSLPNHTYETNSTKPNLQNQTYQTKPTKPNQNFQRNKSKAPKLNSWAKLANPNVNQSQTSLSLPWACHSSAPSCLPFLFRCLPTDKLSFLYCYSTYSATCSVEAHTPIIIILIVRLLLSTDQIYFAKTLRHITSYLVEPLWQKTHYFLEPFQQVTSYLPEPIGQMSEKTCVFRHLTDKRLENEKFKVSVKCLFYLLWIGHLTYRSDVYRSDGV